MDGVAVFAFKVAAIHAMVAFEVADHGFDGGSALEELSFLCTEAFAFAAVDEFDPWDAGICATVPEVRANSLWADMTVLHQDAGLLHLLGQAVAVIGVAMKRSGTDDEIAFAGAGNADFDTKFIRLAGLAFVDAIDCMPGACAGRSAAFCVRLGTRFVLLWPELMPRFAGRQLLALGLYVPSHA